MSNHWGRPPRTKQGQSFLGSISVILLIGLLVYFLAPQIKTKIVSLIKPSYAATNPYNADLPRTSNSSVPNMDSTFTNSNSNSSSTYNLSGNIQSNEVTTGYWLLFIANGQMSQLSVDAETTAFIRQLIEKDRNSQGKNTLVLFENSRSRQYMVSDEVNSVVTSLSVIDTRVSSSSGNTTLNGSINLSPNRSANSNPSDSNSTNSGSANSSSPNSSPANTNSTNSSLNNSSNTSPNPAINPSYPQSSNANSFANSASSSTNLPAPSNQSNSNGSNNSGSSVVPDSTQDSYSFDIK